MMHCLEVQPLGLSSTDKEFTRRSCFSGAIIMHAGTLRVALLSLQRPRQGVFIEKGPFFHGKGALRAPQIPHKPPHGPSPQKGGKGVLKIPVGGLPKERSVGNLGSARGPFTVKKRPLLDENALNPEKTQKSQKVSRREFGTPRPRTPKKSEKVRN